MSILKLWRTISKRSDINITRVPEEGQNGTEGKCEVIMAENFPNLMRNTNPQIQKAQRMTSKGKSIKPILRHIIFKQQETKTNKTTTFKSEEVQTIHQKASKQEIRDMKYSEC